MVGTTHELGHGGSNTVPRQSIVNASDTVMHCCSDAHLIEPTNKTE
jgi:hypothetical protein